MSLNIVRAGWLMRKSSILKRWKRCWLVLYDDGNLAYFDNEDSLRPEETFNIIAESPVTIKASTMLNNEAPPEGVHKDSVFGVCGKNSQWILSGDSVDDAYAWYLSLNDTISNVSANIPPPRPRSTGNTIYYQQQDQPQLVRVQGVDGRIEEIPIFYRGSDGRIIMPQQIIQHPDGTRTIVLGRDGVNYNRVRCCCHRGYNCGCGYYDYLGAGLATGLVASTLLWSPFLFWPMFWC